MAEMESDEYVESLIKTIEKEKGWDPFLRGGTIVLLGVSGNPKAIKPLVTLLREEDSEIRRDVAESLGEYGKEAVPPLIKALKDKDWKVQWGAAEALSDIGEPAQIPLVQLLHDEDWKVQWGAAEALRRGKLWSALVPPAWKGVIIEQSGEILIQHISDKDWEIRWRAMVTLGELQDTRAVEPLIDALKNADNHIKERAARTLGKIKDKRAVEPLIGALKDEYRYVRIQAAYSLGKTKDERAIIPLIDLLKEKGKYPPYVSEMASYALSQIGEPAVIPLITVLKDESAPLSAHYQATESLGRIGKPATEHLIAAMKDPAWKIGWGAIALGKTGDKRAVEPLIKALKDEDREIRGRAAMVLGNLGDARAVSPLIETLEDADDYAAGRAAIALRNLGAPALKPLVKAYKLTEGKVRSSVIWDLGAVGDASVVNLLIEALKDECWKVREHAVRSLGEILKREQKIQEGTDEVNFNVKEMEELVVESIIRAVEDTHEDVRCWAVRILGAIGNEKVIKPLTRALKDEDENVRRVADDMLKRIMTKGSK